MHHKGIVSELREAMLDMMNDDRYRFDDLARMLALEPDLILYLLKQANEKRPDQEHRPTSILSIVDILGSGRIETVISESVVFSDEHGTRRRHMVSRYGQAHLSAIIAERMFPGLTHVPRTYFLAGLLVDIVSFEYFVEACHPDLCKALLSLAKSGGVLKEARALRNFFERGMQTDHAIFAGWTAVTARAHAVLFHSES